MQCCLPASLGELAGGAASSPPTGKQQHVCPALRKALCNQKLSTDTQDCPAFDSSIEQMSEESSLQDKLKQHKCQLIFKGEMFSVRLS